MRTLFLISLLTVLSIIQSYGQTKNSNNKERNTASMNETPLSTEIAILPYENSFYWVFKDAKNATLNGKELNEIETIFKNCIAEYNVKAEEQYNNFKINHPDSKFEKSQLVLDIPRYKRQYMAIINAKGEKEVWINCFCETWDKNWRKEVVMVKDGGNCYFNLKINLSAKTYYEMSVNGEA